MAGLLSNTLREQPPPERGPVPEDQDILIDPEATGEASDKSVIVKFPDGSVTINLGGSPKNDTPLHDAKFNANLAEHLEENYLGMLADDLLRGIEDDELSRADWLEERAEGIKLLALKVEKPSSASTGSASGTDNTSRSRHTMLLEAVLRFQANARSELLPTDGPCKVEAANGSDTASEDNSAQLLEDDFNYYLTVTASEYYPDTDRMLLWVGAGGSGFKKVYRCPVRRRPVSESVDAADICVSNGATDLMNADRVTFKSRMRQTTMKRMKFLEVYRDVSLGQPSAQMKNAVDQAKEEITGQRASMRPEDAPYEILECYCMIDVDGDEHKDGGKISGIPRPYKVTIDKESRTILEIRRNWNKEDELERSREVFVKFPFVPGFGFYDLGLIQIAGNPTVAATALLRIMIDSGIFGNFPGGLVGKGSDKQNTTDIAVNPGAFAPIDVSMAKDGDIRKVVMPLPYKEAGPGIAALLDAIVKGGSRLAGVPDISVGEGKQDAPVGTTLALIEQATKPMDAVHKRLHAAQSKEFELLRNLFIEYPEDFWKFNQKRDSNWDVESLTKALNDFNLVPRADPNTSSQLQRIMRAQALYKMCDEHPELYQIKACLDYVMHAIGVHNPDAFINPNPQLGGGGNDPAAQAKLIGAQADMQDSQTKAADLAFKMKNSATEDQNRDLDRQADVRIVDTKLRTEQVIHQSQQAGELQSQVSAQRHERAMQANDLQAQQNEVQTDAQTAGLEAHADLAKHATGLVSDHVLQAREHEHATDLAESSQKHATGLAKMKPKPAAKQKRADGGRVENDPLPWDEADDRPSKQLEIEERLKRLEVHDEILSALKKGPRRRKVIRDEKNKIIGIE